MHKKFIQKILSFWKQQGRHDLPWRKNINPYRVLVSEVMLQQTQVERVIPFYRKFLRLFPSFRALARAPVGEILRAWQGLGYNRRVLMLQRCAQAVAAQYRGKLPDTAERLADLPGIGPYTAGALMAFAFDKPVPVIETNIRRVYLHHFFPGRHAVPDARILSLVARHLAMVASPREWYSALMDYGTYLADAVPNPNRRSRHYAKQAKFDGSVRQLRGKVLRLLAARKAYSRKMLEKEIGDARLPGVLLALKNEGFITGIGGILRV